MRRSILKQHAHEHVKVGVSRFRSAPVGRCKHHNHLTVDRKHYIISLKASTTTETTTVPNLPITTNRGSEFLRDVIPFGIDISLYPSMTGCNVLVTGSARGIGFNTARLLASLGANVYLADVNEKGLKQAERDISEQISSAEVMATPRLDLGSTSAVHAWCDAWLAGKIAPIPSGQSVPKLDVLINNAGANFMGVEPFYTPEGTAGLPQVNFVGPYTLTRRLLPSLRAAGNAARVVNVSSVMHRVSSLPSDPSFFLTDWWEGGAYRNCKHANAVFTMLLQQAADQATDRQGTPKLTCLTVDPGAVYSNLWSTSAVFGKPPGSTIIKSLFATPEDACATSFHAAAGADVRPGQYWARGMFAYDGIVKAGMDAQIAALSCLDWPLRSVSRGGLAADLKPVELAPQAQAAVTDGRGVALWDAAADLAGLPRWDQGL